MTKRNITLTSIVLLILVIIIGSSLAIARPNLLGMGGLDLNNLGELTACLHGGLEALDDGSALGELGNAHVLTDAALSVGVDNLSGFDLGEVHV